MALCKRLIARLDIKGSRLIKGIRFEGLRVLGDPCDAAVRYAKDGADELLYVDTVASLYGRNSLTDLLRTTSKAIFIPVTAGGGVRCVGDAAALLAAGADKIAVNTAALKRPKLITELAEAFGKQCVVASIQARRIDAKNWEAMSEAGRERSGRDVIQWCQELQSLGAGEILITSVDQDGTCNGPDELLNNSIAKVADVPLIVGGGFCGFPEIKGALDREQISAVALGAVIHKNKAKISDLKKELLKDQSVRTCQASESKEGLTKIETVNARVGIVDYGMGNQQSLVNAMRRIGADVTLTADTDLLEDCQIVMLPGVGSFGNGMTQLRERKLDSWLISWAARKKPLVGICLGMQMLFDEGLEFGLNQGLGIIKGVVCSLKDIEDNEEMTLPHLGWNRLLGSGKNNPGHDSYQYFVHSFVATNVDSSQVMHYCEYAGNRFVASVRNGSVVGFQFHPERSGFEGLSLLANLCNDLLRK